MNTTADFAFPYAAGQLYCESASVSELCRRYGTPLYIYSRTALEKAAEQWLAGLRPGKDRLFYAMKANASKAILQLLARKGLGFDIVSGGELARALDAGADPGAVVYSGVGKTEDEIRFALRQGILCFNVESIPELHRISSIAAAEGLTARISLRVNPDVDAKTHPYISTGLKSNKFGVAQKDVVALYKTACGLPGIAVTGIDCHIGSQITETAPFLDAADRIFGIV
ncbi:MAG: diaminopimelate decarboxylase, partial [Duodenibacillus sp.]|nr:diaminopimelate decarboxylase [Duodenibacillus sp.]